MTITEKILNNEKLKTKLLEQVENLKDNKGEVNLYDDGFSFSNFINILNNANIINYYFEEIRQNDDSACYDCVRVLPRTLHGQDFNKIIEIRDYDLISDFLHLEGEITSEAIIRGIEINEAMVQEFAVKNDFNF